MSNTLPKEAMSETITIRGKWTVETLAQYLRPEGKPPAIGIEQWGLSAFLLAVGLTLVVMALWMRHAEGILGLGICLILGAVGGLAWNLQENLFPDWRRKDRRRDERTDERTGNFRSPVLKNPIHPLLHEF